MVHHRHLRRDGAMTGRARRHPGQAASSGRAPKRRCRWPCRAAGPRRLHVGRARRPPRRRGASPLKRSPGRAPRHERRRDGGGLARRRDRRRALTSKPSGAGPASTGPFPRPARASRPDAGRLSKALDERHRPKQSLPDEPAQHQSVARRDRRAHRLRSRARLHGCRALPQRNQCLDGQGCDLQDTGTHGRSPHGLRLPAHGLSGGGNRRRALLGRRLYGNPAPFALRRDDDRRHLAVQINPLERRQTPRTVHEIHNRLNEISFNSTLVRELRAVAFITQLIEEEDSRPTNTSTSTCTGSTRAACSTITRPLRSATRNGITSSSFAMPGGEPLNPGSRPTTRRSGCTAHLDLQDARL